MSGAAARPRSEDARPGHRDPRRCPPLLTLCADVTPAPLHPTCLAAGRPPPPPRLKLQPPQPQSPPQRNQESGFRAVARVTRAPPPRLACIRRGPPGPSQSRFSGGFRTAFLTCFFTESALRFSAEGRKGARVISLEKPSHTALTCLRFCSST